MNNANKHAFPCEKEEIGDGIWTHPRGLTKREYIAAMVMQGLLSHYGGGGDNATSLAELAVTYADAFLATLEGEE